MPNSYEQFLEMRAHLSPVIRDAFETGVSSALNGVIDAIDATPEMKTAAEVRAFVEQARDLLLVAIHRDAR